MSSQNKCIVSGMDTTHSFAGSPVHKEVLEFARRYRDAMNLTSVRGVLLAFMEMKKFGHDWASIKKKLIDELKDKGITF